MSWLNSCLSVSCRCFETIVRRLDVIALFRDAQGDFDYQWTCIEHENDLELQLYMPTARDTSRSTCLYTLVMVMMVRIWHVPGEIEQLWEQKPEVAELSGCHNPTTFSSSHYQDPLKISPQQVHSRWQDSAARLPLARSLPWAQQTLTRTLVA
jgi:hypothetical protein